MKQCYLFVILVFISVVSKAQMTIGAATTPNAAAVLDLSPATTLGVYPPQVKLTAISSALPVTAPPASLLVYNTQTASTGTADAVTPGFYYWDGGKWVRLLSGSGSITADNGLNINTANNVELGVNPLIKNTIVSLGTYSLTFDGTGTVNIGTATNKSSLNITAGSGGKAIIIDNNASIYGTNSSGTQQLLLTPQNAGNNTILNYGAAGMLIQNNAGTATMNLSNGNQVAIGAAAPAQTLEVEAATGTVRIDGLKSGNSFNSSSTAATSNLLYANNSTGDLYALPTASNSMLVTNGTGIPSWQAAGAVNSLFWSLTGNTGTTASTSGYGSLAAQNFIGTGSGAFTDFVFATGGYERMRILGGSATTGQVLIGAKTAGTANALDEATANATNVNAIAGYTGQATGVGIEGINSAATNTSTGIGIYGVTNQSGGYGVQGVNNSTSAGNAVGVYGNVSYAGNSTSGYYPIAVEGNASAAAVAAGAADGVDGYTKQPDGYGVYGSNSNASGVGLKGANTAASGTSGGDGIDGITSQAGTASGVYGENDYPSTTTIGGIGVWGYQNGPSGFTPLNIGLVTGGGGSFIGNGPNTNGSNIIGVAGYANYGSASSPSTGGIFAGGYFATRIAQTSPYAATTYAYVGVQYLGTQYKIVGTGGVSTIVKDTKKNLVTMYCPEATEMLFEDYGTAKLVNGKVHIALDPIYAKNIIVNEKHQLRVMITLNDQCNGVFVTNRTSTGFDVVELNNGSSNSSFTYQVVANRADEYDDSGNLVSKNADLRFSPAPGPQLMRAKPVKNTQAFRHGSINNK